MCFSGLSMWAMINVIVVVFFGSSAMWSWTKSQKPTFKGFGLGLSRFTRSKGPYTDTSSLNFPCSAEKVAPSSWEAKALRSRASCQFFSSCGRSTWTEWFWLTGRSFPWSTQVRRCPSCWCSFRILQSLSTDAPPARAALQNFFAGGRSPTLFCCTSTLHCLLHIAAISGRLHVSRKDPVCALHLWGEPTLCVCQNGAALQIGHALSDGHLKKALAQHTCKALLLHILRYYFCRSILELKTNIFRNLFCYIKS